MTETLRVFVSSVQKELEDETRLIVEPAVEAQLNERQRRIMQWLAEGQELTSRRCEAEFGVTRPITAGDFGKLVKMGLAERIGAGRSTRYRLRRPAESSSNRKEDGPNRKPPRRGAQGLMPRRIRQ